MLFKVRLFKAVMFEGMVKGPALVPPKDKLDKVFEQFYRVSGAMQHTFPGLGLGLYISSEIIKREGGRIWVTSVEGKGSTFCFELPAKRGENPQQG